MFACTNCGRPTTRPGRCPTCPPARRALTTAQRGYGAPHQTLRRSWQHQINQTGGIPCGRCGTIIRPGDNWDLGHTSDRASYTGPECSICNRGNRPAAV